VTQYYDNLMAKLVVWGSDRTAAINRGKRALKEFKVEGLATTIPAHLAVLDHPDFIAGEHHTKWMEDSVEIPAPSPGSTGTLPEDEALNRRDITVEVGGRRFSVAYWAPEPNAGGGSAVKRRRPKLSSNTGAAGSDGVITAPMQGTIVKVHVKAGSSVKAGAALCVLEAMKMENEVSTPNGGEVVDLRVEPGDTVSPGQVIAIIK
jgi:acetyl-CoA/propionyl-CoA carboxylase biotin carboxyl carrier protein